MILHPYIKYGAALIMAKKGYSSIEEITSKDLLSELEEGINAFRLKPGESIEGKNKIKYVFVKEEKGNPQEGIFLSPNVISTDSQAKNTWNQIMKIIQVLQQNDWETQKILFNDLHIDKKNIFHRLKDISKAVAPVAGEFVSFSEQGNIGRGNPKSPFVEKILAAITTLTPWKPCLQYRTKDNPDFNVCIIPDIPIKDLVAFIALFKRMSIQRLESDLMYGEIRIEKKGTGETEKIKYILKRPYIFKGNFPNAPRSSFLGGVSLLAAIGEFLKETEYSELARCVLDSFEGATMYMIKYGDASVFTYNHYIIDLARQSKLREVVDSLYYSKLYNQEKRSLKSVEYQKFDLFANRFLLLFNNSSFKDFLSFRAEYPVFVEILFNIYFIKMEKIGAEVVASAKKLGEWLNLVAYLAAKSEATDPKDWTELQNLKAKVLVRLESAAFSAKTGDELIAKVVTQAGRISNLDAPEDAALFMEKTASGELALSNAKNLLIAFSRLKNKKQEPAESVALENGEDDSEVDEDLSDD